MGDTATRKAATISPLPSTYSVELTKTPLGLGLSLTDDVVTEIKSDSQVARDGRIKVGDRVVAVNGEAPTTAKPSSTILQGIGAGTIVKLEFTSEPQAVSAMTEAGQSSSVSASQSKDRPVPGAVRARDSQKMSGAAELLESWKLEPSELVHGNKVGSGGQADVYLGRWQGLPVAIKKQRGSDQRKTSEAAMRSITQAVRREVRALARVRHPNVVRLYGACMEQPPCLVMAYAAGGALDDAVREGRFASINAVITLLAGVARGMEAVHAHKIIHLDLKPENVLLSADNVPWVTDFGLSTSSNLTSMSTSSAGGRGTIYFKAPELFAYPPVVSAAADVYAFAVLAWVVCTREQPYQNLQSVETTIGPMLAQGVRPELPDGDDWRDTTTAGLAKLIEHCWQTEHGGRPTFGGAEGVVAMLTNIETRMLKKDEDATVETMLSRMWTA